MKQAVAILASVALMATPALADFYIPGTFNGWDNTTPMTETSAGSGVWEYGVPAQNPGDNLLMDILSVSGDWNSKVHPSGNQWAKADAAGTNTITLDTNAAGDGWYPDAMRVGVAFEPATTWTAVGDWQDQVAGGGQWDFSHPGTAMNDMGGGIYMYEATLNPGIWQYKAVQTGTWDAIGGNSRNVNADNFGFETTAVNPIARMWVNVFAGTVKVDVVPEPASLALVSLGLLALIRRR